MYAYRNSHNIILYYRVHKFYFKYSLADISNIVNIPIAVNYILDLFKYKLLSQSTSSFLIIYFCKHDMQFVHKNIYPHLNIGIRNFTINLRFY